MGRDLRYIQNEDRARERERDRERERERDGGDHWETNPLLWQVKWREDRETEGEVYVSIWKHRGKTGR